MNLLGVQIMWKMVLFIDDVYFIAFILLVMQTQSNQQMD